MINFTNINFFFFKIYCIVYIYHYLNSSEITIFDRILNFVLFFKICYSFFIIKLGFSRYLGKFDIEEFNTKVSILTSFFFYVNFLFDV